MGQIHSSKSASKLVVIGSIGAPFGVNGWLKVNSYTDPRENILKFKQKPWFLVEEQNSIKPPLSCKLLDIKGLNDKFVVLFAEILDRSQAAILTNKKIAIKREDLPELAESEYYWADLIGCKVYNLSEEFLGILEDMLVTAANDIMIVKQTDQKYLIPYSLGEFVVKVDLPNQLIIVDWDMN